MASNSYSENVEALKVYFEYSGVSSLNRWELKWVWIPHSGSNAVKSAPKKCSCKLRLFKSCFVDLLSKRLYSFRQCDAGIAFSILYKISKRTEHSVPSIFSDGGASQLVSDCVKKSSWTGKGKFVSHNKANIDEVRWLSNKWALCGAFKQSLSDMCSSIEGAKQHSLFTILEYGTLIIRTCSNTIMHQIFESASCECWDAFSESNEYKEELNISCWHACKNIWLFKCWSWTSQNIQYQISRRRVLKRAVSFFDRRRRWCGETVLPKKIKLGCMFSIIL